MSNYITLPLYCITGEHYYKMLEECYVFYVYFYFVFRTKIFSEKVCKSINKK